METWQKREKHHKDFEKVLKEQKCIDSKSQIRAWRKDNWKLLNELGHNSLDFEKCSCSK